MKEAELILADRQRPEVLKRMIDSNMDTCVSTTRHSLLFEFQFKRTLRNVFVRIITGYSEFTTDTTICILFL